MSFIIFGDSFTFPEGDAATNRVHTYAKGFTENNLKTHVICFGSEYDAVGDGNINGIYYYHPFGERARNKYFIIRRWKKFAKYLKTITLIKEISRNGQIIVLHCYTQLLVTQIFGFVLAKAFGSKLILERSEHPMRHYDQNAIWRIIGYFKIALEKRFCDGIFCISNYLINFYLSRGCNMAKLFLVPSTVDPERFSNALTSPFNFKYILYCGSLTILKDGVDILIESYARICQKHPDIKLVLVGEADTEKDEIFFRELISKLSIDDRVILTGKLSRTAVPAYMCNADVLALARPKSKVADAGFPSKLTEYLATGNPVAVTKVGEIPFYLKDNENAFLVEPGNVDEFADKLDYILSNQMHAKQVGRNGKELTLTVFNYNVQAKRILEYINHNSS